MDNLLKLEFLDISKNKLRNLEKGSTPLLPQLKILLMDFNYLKHINFIVKFPNLRYFSIQSNKIPDIKSVEKISELQFIEELFFNGNSLLKIYSYRLNVLRKNPKLKKIDGIIVTNEELAYIENEECGMSPNEFNNLNSNMNINYNTNFDNQNIINQFNSNINTNNAIKKNKNYSESLLAKNGTNININYINPLIITNLNSNNSSNNHNNNYGFNENRNFKENINPIKINSINDNYEKNSLVKYVNLDLNMQNSINVNSYKNTVNIPKTNFMNKNNIAIEISKNNFDDLNTLSKIFLPRPIAKYHKKQ